MQCLGRIEKAGGDANAVEGPRELLGDVGILAHAAEDQFFFFRQGHFNEAHDLDEFSVEGLGRGGDGFAFNGEATAGLGEDGFIVQRHQILESGGTSRKPTGRALPFNTFPALLLPSINFRRWHLAPLFAAAMFLGLTGCGDRDRLSYATETDEPYYREGVSLLKTGRQQEALTAFLKVIDKRGEDAPESHLEIGLLYLQHINDPLSAIYHFKKYLALRPNSPQAPLVRQRIDAAIREFARTLPAQPLDTATKRVDLIAAMDKLKMENDQLKQQLADLQANRDSSPTLTVSTQSHAPSATQSTPDNKLSLNFETIPTVRTRSAPPAAATPVKPAPLMPSVATPSIKRHENTAVKPAPASPSPTTSATAGARKHVVQKGDTLSNLAQKYYKNRAKWRDIYAANRKVMKNEGDIHIGMQLVIP